MGGGDLNTKKSWHPNTMKNQERVWKAEQAAAEEKKRILELQREREEENDRTQLKEMAQRNFGANISGGTSDNRLHWMYDKPDKHAQQEDYLLGKAIGKSDEADNAPQNAIPALSRRVVLSSMNTTGDDSQVDLVRKLREDPLLLVKERERAARAALLNNPLQRKKLTELLRKEKEQKEIKMKKKSKKKKKDLDDALAAKLNALAGNKGIDLTSLLNSDDSSESSSDQKSKKKKRKHGKKSKKSKKKDTSSDSETDSGADSKKKKKSINEKVKVLVEQPPYKHGKFESRKHLSDHNSDSDDKMKKKKSEPNSSLHELTVHNSRSQMNFSKDTQKRDSLNRGQGMWIKKQERQQESPASRFSHRYVTPDSPQRKSSHMRQSPRDRRKRVSPDSPERNDSHRQLSPSRHDRRQILLDSLKSKDRRKQPSPHRGNRDDRRQVSPDSPQQKYRQRQSPEIDGRRPVSRDSPRRYSQRQSPERDDRRRASPDSPQRKYGHRRQSPEREKRRKVSPDLPQRKNSQRKQSPERDGRSRILTDSPQRKVSHKIVKDGENRRQGLSEEEKAARLAEMAAAGMEREVERGHRVAKQRAEESEEASGNSRVPRALQHEARALPDSLESRIHSNRHYIQRDRRHMNENFARR